MARLRLVLLLYFFCYIRARKSSDELVLEMTSEMMKHIPQEVEEEEEETEAGTSRTPKMSLRDLIKILAGQDLKKIKKKLKIPEHVSKKKDGR